MHTLYYAPGAASMVVHWLLLELDQAPELRLLDFATREQKSPEYLALNPSGVVPTLVIDGEPMSEAAAILMHLAAHAQRMKARPSFQALYRREGLSEWN